MLYYSRMNYKLIRLGEVDHPGDNHTGINCAEVKVRPTLETRKNKSKVSNNFDASIVS